MAETDEIARMLGEAERATAAGNHKAAERALRQALRAQESQFGLVHPDVAGTLNSLGTVCQALGRPQEAEFLYRRALGVARKTLTSEHPHIATSLRHLSELYEGQGRPDKLSKVMEEALPRSGLPVDAPTEKLDKDQADKDQVDVDKLDLEVGNSVVEPRPSLPPILVEPAPDDQPGTVTDADDGIGLEVTLEAPVNTPDPESPSAPEAPVTSTREDDRRFPPQLYGRLMRPSTLAAVAIILLALLWLFSGRNGSPGAVAPGGPLAETPAASASSEPWLASQPDEAPTGEPEAAALASSTPPVPQPDTEPLVDPAEPGAAAPTVTRSAALVEGSSDSARPLEDISWSVVEAEVCARFVNRGADGNVLVQWRCEPVGDIADPGELFFYTRIRSRTRTTVEHRWLRDGVLDREVALNVGANDGPGYRTFSSRTVFPGTWRVELRSREQELLHAGEFEVR